MTGAAGVRADSFERCMELSPEAVALTRGAEHRVVYMNRAFRRLAGGRNRGTSARICDAFEHGCPGGLIDVLDRVRRTGEVERETPIALSAETGPEWMCSVWPEARSDGDVDLLILEVRRPTQAERSLEMQRDVAERVFASVLREHDVAQSAEASERRSAFLASEGRRLGESLDERATLDAISRTSFPRMGAWCIVDILEAGDRMQRLTIVHAEPAEQQVLRDVEKVGWPPRRSDAFGLGAMVHEARPLIVSVERARAAIAESVGDAVERDALNGIGIGPLLTVPLLIDDRLAGAITFVGNPSDPGYDSEDVAMAQGLATRAASALDHARAHAEIVALKQKAEVASDAKSQFLGTMSHELRTPLNAIGGYVELMEMGLRGPVTAEQHADFERIKHNQRYLLALITDVLNFVRIGNDRVPYEMQDVIVRDVVAASVELVEPLAQLKKLVRDCAHCDRGVVARADRDRVTQIIVNLLSNAIKFTPTGGRVDVECEIVDQAVRIHVSDTGIGIAPEMLESIFDPFVQVRAGLVGRDAGAGLGLAISRGLARAMNGDLTVTSTPGSGSSFTLTLPAVQSARGPGGVGDHPSSSHPASG